MVYITFKPLNVSQVLSASNSWALPGHSTAKASKQHARPSPQAMASQKLIFKILKKHRQDQVLSCTALRAVYLMLCVFSCTMLHAAGQTPIPDRPGGPYDSDCGSESMAACHDGCREQQDDMQPSEWCPAGLDPASGCQKGLSRVSITPSPHLVDVTMPDVCLVMPKEWVECGVAGKPCCLFAGDGDPRSLVRALCEEGLTCMVSQLSTAIPFGGTRHMQSVLAYPGSSGLLETEVMGSCMPLPPNVRRRPDPPNNSPNTDVNSDDDVQSDDPAAGVDADSVVIYPGQPVGNGHGRNSVLGECGTGLPSCPNGTYCASNDDHLLGLSRCLPFADCGGPYQACCPPYYSGQPAVLSIVDHKTAMPTCNDPQSVCVWPGTVQGFDPSYAENKAVGLKPPVVDTGSTSVAVQFPRTMCLPKMDRCGEAGQPCCPHSQFASSNHPMYFRLHVCDPGLRCSETISILPGPVGSNSPAPVLGVCVGSQQHCGRQGQKCCVHTDQAGWDWRTCEDGQPGVFCGPDSICRQCPGSKLKEAGANQAGLAAALSLPGVGNPC